MIKLVRPALIIGFAIWSFRLAYQFNAHIDAIFALLLSLSIYMNNEEKPQRKRNRIFNA